MSDIIKQQLQIRKIPTIPQPDFKKKLTIHKKDVSLDFVLANDIGKTYKIVFYVNVSPSQREKDPSKLITPKNVNMMSLRNAIIRNISSFDRQYMTLHQFDTKKAVFYLKTDKYIKDAFNNVKPKTRYSSFRREFDLKRKIPDMIQKDPAGMIFDKFLVRKIKDFMEDKRKETKWFGSLIPRKARRKIRQKIRNMFKWEYDYMYNRIIATLKPIYILAIIYAVGEMTDKLKKSHLDNRNTKKMFDTKVKENLKKFNAKKFSKFVKRKGFV